MAKIFGREQSVIDVTLQFEENKGPNFDSVPRLYKQISLCNREYWLMYRSAKLWKRIRTRILQNGESQNHVARTEGISRGTIRKILLHPHPVGYGGRPLITISIPRKKIIHPPKPCKLNLSVERWKEWLFVVEQKNGALAKNPSAYLPHELLTEIIPVRHNRRIKAMTILAKLQGFPIRDISIFLNISRNTIKRYLRDYEAGGATLLFNRKQKPVLADEETLQKAVFTLLHEPPSLHGFNRTTWRLADLHSTLDLQGFTVGKKAISTIIKNAGFRWRSAKIVLTSNDPDYRQKLQHVQSILSALPADERFFSIDEYGPFAIKRKAGRVLVQPDVHPSVPQRQKSKGWLILTAALELSSNQVSHFYSTKKDTAEMIRMAKLLVKEYANCQKLYLSWDAASWHISKELKKFIEDHNSQCLIGQGPLLELAPLPASAQFLNVIESVFSGMARAIIHNSDYSSVAATKVAIDRYFRERNEGFKENPKRAGNKIWGLERTTSEFDLSNNCKDPAYR